MLTFETFLHVITDTLKDALLILPVLFLAYLLMEALENVSGDKLQRALKHTGRLGPLLGAVLGVVPECGVAAAAGSFYAGRLITRGTTLAVFLSTSDELIPIFLSAGAEHLPVLFRIIGLKLVVAVIVGYTVDFLWRRRAESVGIHELCERDHCGCDDGEHASIFRSAAVHTVKILALIAATSFVLGLVVHAVGHETVGRLITDVPVLGQMAAGLLGLIPNCASSVLITELYLEGVISGGALLSGLLVSAGTGVLVLFRANRPRRETVFLVAILYGSGVLFGCLLGFLL